MQMGEPSGIRLFIDQDVVGLRRAKLMAPDLHRPVVVVELDIKETLAVRAPPHRAVGLLDQIAEVGPGRPVAHADGKIFRALDVGAPGLKPVIRRMPRAAELEVFMLRRKLIAIEDDLGLAALAFPRPASSARLRYARAGFRYSRFPLRDISGCRDRPQKSRAAPPASWHPSATHSHR